MIGKSQLASVPRGAILINAARGEVLDQAFEIIREQLDLEDWMLGQREEVAAHIAAGFEQAERGELIDGDAVIKILRQRRAERLKQRG